MLDQTALITGAARRLGRAMALELAALGYDIVLHYAGSKTEAEETAAEIRALGVRVNCHQADLLVEAETKALAQAPLAFDQPWTVLVNNASIFEYDNIKTATRDSWDRHFDSNLRAPFILTQAFAAQIETGVIDNSGEPMATGNIINMVDQRVRKLTPEFMTYTLAKSALWTLTQTSARALAPDIRVNAIGPGPTLRGARQSVAHFENQRQATILKRGANPGDITAALRFILASPSLTGQLLCIDGGQHLGWQTPDIQGVE